MNFGLILFFFTIGIIPVSIYLTLYKNVYSKLRSFVFSSVLLIFTIVVCYSYQQTTNISFSILDYITTIILNLSFNYLALTGKIGISRLLKSTVTICLFFFASFFQLIPISIFSLDVNNLNPVVNNFLTLFSDTSLLIILTLMYYEELKTGIIKLKENFNNTFDISVRYWLIGFIFMIVSNLIINILFPDAIAGNENSVQSMIKETPVIMFFTAGIIAPIVEELVFRQALKDIFLSPKIYILVSGIIFGFLHVAFSYTSYLDFLYVIPYSSLGIAFAYCVDKTNNITSSIMMHIMHNSIIILFSIMAGMIIL